MSGEGRYLLDTNAIVSLLGGNRLLFCERVEVIPMTREDDGLVKQTLDLRSRYRLKLPDAIIGATALSCDAVLVTNDTDFGKVPSLNSQVC